MKGENAYPATSITYRFTVLALLVVLILSTIPATGALPVSVLEPSQNDDNARDKIPPQSSLSESHQDSLLQMNQVPKDGTVENNELNEQEHTLFSSILIKTEAACFDPLMEEPGLPVNLLYSSENEYYLIQCKGPIQPDWTENIEKTGALILGYIPDYTFIIHMDGKVKENIENLPFIRWIGTYHPTYKIQSGLLEKEGEIELNIVVFRDREDNLQNVRNRLGELGGSIMDEGEENGMIRVRIDTSMIRNIAFLPEVEWIDEYSSPITLMNNVRVFTGAETLDLNGFNGTGIVGEVKDNGCDLDHPDFEGQLIGTDGNPTDEAHGTCTFGIVFSSGENDEDALGMMPGGKGVFSSWGVSRTNSIANLVDDWDGVFQSNSWSQGGLDSTYTSYSQENDQVIFNYDVSMLYAAGNSNWGVYYGSCSQDSVAKNVIGVGAVNHFDDTDKSNDRWVNSGAGATPSQGPASDGRIKPDLAGVFDAIYTTDSVDGDGENGYSPGNYFSDFGGTSGATPIVAGATGLLYQIYRENVFKNNPSGSMPHTATVKAILIADAYQYDLTMADRYQQGWGLVDVGNVYDIGKNHLIVDEEISLKTGELINYTVTPTNEHPLKISLVWTDVPGTTSAAQHLVNDLDLRVTDPNGNVYLGNVGLLTSKWSSTGGGYDRLNNVENVFIQTPIPGDWKIEIIAHNIAMDGNPDTPQTDQNFALVASGVIQAEHDLATADIQVPTYLAPNEAVIIETTILNNGLSNETDFVVNFTVDDEVQESKTIPKLDSGAQTQLSFDWVPVIGIYMVGIEVEILPNENYTDNNFLEKIVIVEPDLAVTGIESEKYLKPNKHEEFQATIENLGKIDVSNVEVQLLVDDGLENYTIISSLPAESLQIVPLGWTPTKEGWFKIEIYVIPVMDEEIDTNNKANLTLLATSEELVKVAVLDSWGTDFSEEAPWDHINDNWMYLGTTPVEIDYTTLNKNDITYDELVGENADVLVISCAFAWEFTDSEIDAISRYVQEGHGLIATAGTFYWYVPNNNKLAPLFGMRDDITYYDDVTSDLNLIEPYHPLFFNIPKPYTPGSDVTILPPDNSWDTDDLTEGRYIAKSPDNMGAIIVNKGLVYISHWIGSESNQDDFQLFYNAMLWSKYELDSHDIAVLDIVVPPYVSPNQKTFVNATVVNLGLNEETDILVNFSVDGNIESTMTIPSLESLASTPVSFMWTAPSFEGSYMVKIESSAVPNENFTKNNNVHATVIVTTGPELGRIGLVSDSTQLQAIASTLDDLGKTYDILNNNAVNGFTGNISLLLHYQIVIFYNDDRAIDGVEQRALNDYIALGGVLLVTGYDSLGDPIDPRLAEVVRSSGYGNNLGESMFIVRDGLHPIMDGVYGQYPTDSLFTMDETDHDEAEADILRGAQTIAELTDGFDKIVVTELSSGGKVIYWNGNLDCDDWTQNADMEAMLKNLIVWIMPIYDDVGIVSFTSPAMSFIGEDVSIQAMVKNFGVNDQSGFEVVLEIMNSYGFIVFREVKSDVTIDSRESTYLTWQWSTTLCDYYTFEIFTQLADDEVITNNRIKGQMTVYTKFFSDDMEGGIGNWNATSSSLIRPPLWHQTDTDSYSPTTSWWCGEDTTSQYTIWADQYLISQIIDLSEATSVFLSFHHKYSIDDFPLLPDWGDVEINPGGSGWETLESYTGTWSAWSQVVLDLSPYIGEQIQIRFTLSSGVLLTDNGWWVDDVDIFGMGNQYGIQLSVDYSNVEVGKGESALYQIQAKNIGNVLGTLEMSLSGTGTENWFAGFSPQIYSFLLPGESIVVNLTIIPFSTVQGDHPFDVTGDLTESGAIKASDTLPLSLTVSQWYGVQLTTQNDQLSLIPSETNYYIITVKNEGNGPDTILLCLEESIFGISSGWQFELNRTFVILDAFSQEDITLSITAPSNGYPDDRIEINIIGTSQGNASEFAQVTTITTVLEYFSLELNSSQTIKETEAGIPANYELIVINHGNSQVNVNIDLDPASGAWGGWKAVLNTKNLNIGAFSSRTIFLDVTPPEDALAFDSKDINVTAISPGSESSLTVRTIVALTGELKVEVDDPIKEEKSGESARYYLTLTNMQNHDDTFDISSHSINGWHITLFETDGITLLQDTDDDLKPDTGVLDDWDGTIDIVVDMDIPKNAIAFTSDLATITFASSLPNGGTKSIELSTEVRLTGDIVLGTESDSRSEVPGEMVSFLVSVKNSLNYQTTIDLTVSSKNGWNVGLFFGDGSTLLYDHNDNDIPDTGSLSAFGGTDDIIVRLEIPDYAIAYTTDVITLTGTTAASNEISYSMELYAIVDRVYDVEIVFDGGELSVERGKSLTYTIRLSNNGNFEELIDIRFIELPRGWEADFSDDEPTIPVGKSRVISVTMDIPSNAEPGEYPVFIAVTSNDGTPLDDLTLTIDVGEEPDEFEFPFVLLLLLLLIVGVIIALLVMRRRGEEEEIEGEAERTERFEETEGFGEGEGAERIDIPKEIRGVGGIEGAERIEERVDTLKVVRGVGGTQGIEERIDKIEEIEDYKARREYDAYAAPPPGYREMMFPSIEIITCPNCYNSFEEEIGVRPFRVFCPRCGASGLVR